MGSVSRVSTQTTTCHLQPAIEAQYSIADMVNVRRNLCSWSHVNVSVCVL